MTFFGTDASYLMDYSTPTASFHPVSGFTNPVVMETKRRQRQALLNMGPLFEQNLEPRDVVPQLLARRALRSTDRGLIYAQRDRYDRVRKLLEVLPGRDPWWGPFIDSLIRSGNSQMAEMLLVQSSNPNSTYSGSSASASLSSSSSSPRDSSISS